MKKQKSIATREAYEEFRKALEAFDAEALEEEVTCPSDIYRYYGFIDRMYVWLKNAYESDLQSLENEMRAILGHMSEYSLDESNLQKAYGHIRRLSTDTLKILCNGLDLEFEEWILKHASFDYNNQDNLYIPMYVKKYNDAHKKYLEVQQKENLGSNKKNRIIVSYYEVAKLFGSLYEYHISERREKIHKRYRCLTLNRKIWTAATIIISVISIIGYLISR